MEWSLQSALSPSLIFIPVMVYRVSTGSNHGQEDVAEKSQINHFPCERSEDIFLSLQPCSMKWIHHCGVIWLEVYMDLYVSWWCRSSAAILVQPSWMECGGFCLFVLVLKTLLYLSQSWCVANNSLGKTVSQMLEQDSHSIEKILSPFG